METLLRSQRYNQIFCQALRMGGSFLILMSVIRFMFFFLSAPSFEIIERSIIWQAFFVGFRFDLLVLGFIFIPVVIAAPCWLLLGGTEGFCTKFLKIYFSLTWVLIILTSAVSLLHYVREGRHFRWLDPIYEPSLDITSVTLATLIFLFMIASVLKSVWNYFEYSFPFIIKTTRLPATVEVTLRILAPILLVILAARGSVGAHHLEKEDAQISAWENVNELGLNSVWCINK